jgi:hypothetical protein
MQFKDWTNLSESSLNDLYQSTLDAFPRTTKRQNSIDLVKIVELHWTPFVGVKTLFVKGTVESGESGKVYEPIILFKGVRYHSEKENVNWVEIVANNGQNYVIERLNYGHNDILLRCGCGDFKWRFNYYNHLDGSLYGNKRTAYESHGGATANPREFPGMCKHLIKLIQSLDHAGLMEV